MEEIRFEVEDHGIVEGPLTQKQTATAEEYGIVPGSGLETYYHLDGIGMTAKQREASVRKFDLDAYLEQEAAEEKALSQRAQEKARRSARRRASRGERHEVAHDLDFLRGLANAGHLDALTEWDEAAA